MQVIQNLIQVFQDPDSQFQSPIHCFLFTIYKKNVSNRSKRMDNLQLGRFNAFLYRVVTDYPTSTNANTIIHHSLSAFLLNGRNFLSWENAEILTSIGKWACQLLEITLKRSEYRSAFILLQSIICDERPNISSVTAFKELFVNQPYFQRFELTQSDEDSALKIMQSKRGCLNIKNNILFQLQSKVVEMYSGMIRFLPKKKDVLVLFKKHLSRQLYQKQFAQIFIPTFLSQTITTELLQAILDAFAQPQFNHSEVVTIFSHIVHKYQQMPLYLDLKLNNPLIGTIFAQIFQQFWHQKKDYAYLIDSFLRASSISNPLILQLLLNPSFQSPNLNLQQLILIQHCQYKHAIMLALELIGQIDKRNNRNIFQQLAKVYNYQLPQYKQTVIFHAIHFSKCNQNKIDILSYMLNRISVDKLATPATLEFLPLGKLEQSQFNEQQKEAIKRMYLQYNDSSQIAEKVKSDLLLVCQSDWASSVSQLDKIIKSPLSNIIGMISQQSLRANQIKPLVLLMHLNNTIASSSDFSQVFKELDIFSYQLPSIFADYAIQLEEFSMMTNKVQLWKYLFALFDFSVHSGDPINNISSSLSYVLDGQNYVRFDSTDYRTFVMNAKKGRIQKLRNIKIIGTQLKYLIKKIKQNNSANVQSLQIFQNSMISIKALEVLKAYFEAEIHNSQILNNIFQYLRPEYGFLARLQRVCDSLGIDYIHVLSYTNHLLHEIYSKMVQFLSLIIQSQPFAINFQNQNQSRQLSNNIFNNQTLYREILKEESLQVLFSQAEKLQDFAPLLRIIQQIKYKEILRKAVSNWIIKNNILAFISEQNLNEEQQMKMWKIKSQSFCEFIYQFFTAKITFQLLALQKIYAILTGFMKIMQHLKQFKIPHYHQLQEKILLCLLFVHQSISSNKKFDKYQMPIQEFKHCLIGFEVQPFKFQHFYFCNTCLKSVCYRCMSFFHRHHDLNYLGKQGSCLHLLSPATEQSDDEQQNEQQQHNVLQQVQLQRKESQKNYQLYRKNLEQQLEKHIKDLERKNRHNEIAQQSRINEQNQAVEIDEDSPNPIKQNNNEVMQQRQDLMKYQRTQEIGISNFQIHNWYEHPNFQIPNVAPQFAYQQISTHQSYAQQTIYMQYMKPLRLILLNDLRNLKQSASTMFQQREKGLVIFAYKNQKFQFFRNSQFFNRSLYNQQSLKDLILQKGRNHVAKTLLALNSKYLFYPHNKESKDSKKDHIEKKTNIIARNLVKMISKMKERIKDKKFQTIQMQQEYFKADLLKKKFPFEVQQLLFDQPQNCMLALIGNKQLALINMKEQQKVYFLPLGNDPIIKFQWMPKNPNEYAVAKNNYIQFGKVNAGKQSFQFKISIQVKIRDFCISCKQQNNEKSYLLYIIDVEGSLYLSRFQYMRMPSYNISNSKVIFSGKVQNFQTLSVVDQCIFVSASNGLCYFFKIVEKKAIQLQTFDILPTLASSPYTKEFAIHPFFLSSIRFIHKDKKTTSFVCIIKKLIADQTSKGGYLFIVCINPKNNSMNLKMLHNEDIIDSYQIQMLQKQKYIIISSDTKQNLCCFHHSFAPQPKKQLILNQKSIDLCKKNVQNRKIIDNIIYYNPQRYLTFKQHVNITKDIFLHYKNFKTQVYKHIEIKSKGAKRFFISGFSLVVKNQSENQSTIIFQILNKTYTFTLKKGERQVQFPLHIKQTITAFIQSQIDVKYASSVITVASTNIYGIQSSEHSIYKEAYCHLEDMVLSFMDFQRDNVEKHLSNFNRHSIIGLDLTQFVQLKKTEGYTNHQLNLLMKLQLLRLSIQNKLQDHQNYYQQMLNEIQLYVMPYCQCRDYIWQSCKKLILKLSQVGNGHHRGKIGHPFEYSTFLDCCVFRQKYHAWTVKINLQQYKQAMDYLQLLIFKRITNLYIIIKLHPQYIHNLIINLKKVLSDDVSEQNKHLIFKMCQQVMAITCEYYQVIKNCYTGSESWPEDNILIIFSQVFFKIQGKYFCQMLWNLSICLQRLYKQQKTINNYLVCAIPYFQVKRSQLLTYIRFIYGSDEIQSNLLYNLHQDERELLENVEESQINSQKQLQLQQLFLKRHVNLHNTSHPFIYYQFNFQIATALFKVYNYRQQQNRGFYLMLLFNLLKIIQIQLDERRDKAYLICLFQAILSNLNNVKYSFLFLALNYFFIPTDTSESQQILPSKSHICRQMVHFIQENNIFIDNLVANFEVIQAGQTIPLFSALGFNLFLSQNSLYQLQFLGNLYLNSSKSSQSQAFRCKVLYIVSQYNLNNYTTIVHYHHWKQDLAYFEINRAFSRLALSEHQAIDILYEFSKIQRQKFTQLIDERPQRIKCIQDYLDINQNEKYHFKLIELINTYYEE